MNNYLSSRVPTGVIDLKKDENAIVFVFDNDYFAKLLFHCSGMLLAESCISDSVGKALIDFYKLENDFSSEVFSKLSSKAEFIPALLAKFCGTAGVDVAENVLVGDYLISQGILDKSDLDCLDTHFNDWRKHIAWFNIGFLPPVFQSFVQKVVSSESEWCLNPKRIHDGSSLNLIMQVIVALNSNEKDKLFNSLLESVVSWIDMVLPCSGLRFKFFPTFESCNDSMLITGKREVIDVLAELLFFRGVYHYTSIEKVEGVS